MPTITIASDAFAHALTALVEHVCEIDEETAAAQAKAGALLLDEHKPNWWQHLNLARLDIKDVQWCVVGQAYGDYGSGMRELFGRFTGNQVAFSHGFDTCSYLGARRLEEAWRTEALNRAAADVLV